MSLIGTLAAVAITAILSLGIAQLIVDGLRSQRSIQQRQSTLNVQTAVLDFLSDRSICTANFINTPATATTVIAGGLRNADGNMAIALNTPLENNVVQITGISLGNLRRRSAAGPDSFRGGMTLALTIARIGDGAGVQELTRSVELAVVLKGFNGQAPADEILSCVAIGNDTNNPWLTTQELNIVYQGNNVGIGVSTPTQKLQVNGNILAASFLYPSDERLKTHIQPLSEGLNRLTQLNGVQFSWIESGKPSVGLIAQNVEQILPTAVSTDSITSLKAIDYSQVVALSVQAIKELQIENTTLKQRVQKLELQFQNQKDTTSSFSESK